MIDKKVVKKIRKIRWIRKKTLHRLFLLEMQDIWKVIKQLHKEVNHVKGEIKADLSLKELDSGKWNVIISVDGKTHVDLKGHLNLVLDNIQLFKRIYDFEKSIKENKKNETN